MKYSAHIQNVAQHLHGKRLLHSEIPLQNELIKQALKHGYLKAEPGLEMIGRRWTCRRCGNDDQTLFSEHHCARCQTTCSYCRHCLLLGKVSSCQQLYLWIAPQVTVPSRQETLQWRGDLSPGQKKASEAVIKATHEQQELLVWAVCGAGKTEVLFHGLEAAFSQGKRVLIATPRTDVVKELYPRFMQSFPNIPISALYGGSKDKQPNAQLVLATTHQTMRFYKAFDLVVIDEVDAFPFSYDKSLQYAVHHAKKECASTIYLSATPSSSLLTTPNLTVMKISRRFHGFPLPVPRFQWCGNWQKALRKMKLPHVLMTWIKAHQQKKKPILLFVPSISTLHLVSSLLTEKSFVHASVHADDPNRHQAVQAFRDQNIPLLVTTTILERGVTFADVQVAVLGAEQDIFTEAALVQIAGRVGRKVEAPAGDIVFCHYGISQAMRAARKHIEAMNSEGGIK
ncbi:DEAD/DEAH box helicase [Halalkalibacter kiskunsagensis]|uniref:DEAD/DEAH box helicase n=1 Tax=Halalkalibacter kiskunsagensis TaxID=1548599 RepID=A0ABV6K9H3_9BACI